MADLVPRRFIPLAVASLAIGIILLAFGYLSADEGESGDARGFIIIVAITLIVGYLVWRYVVRRETAGGGSARAALVLGVVAVLTGLLYWTGLAFVLAPAAIALGTLVRDGQGGGSVTAEPGGASVRTESRAQEATIGVALGWAGLLLATVIGLIDVL
jgi:hypothetical protein